ncbi:MAG: hypothetical protein OJF51_001789 [Nitrospira sp.]|nr:MAG: hypothetical protein OJF51_001789 [Nitrospira sp.]
MPNDIRIPEAVFPSGGDFEPVGCRLIPARCTKFNEATGSSCEEDPIPAGGILLVESIYRCNYHQGVMVGQADGYHDRRDIAAHQMWAT